MYIVQGFHDWNVDPHMAIPTLNTLLDHGIEAKVLMGQWDHDYPDRADYQKDRSDPGRGSEAYPQMVRFDWMQDLLEWFTYYLQEKGPKPSLYLEIQNNLGQVQVSLLRVSQQRDNLLSYEEKMQTEFLENQEEEKKFIDKITEKYGDGELNPSTGEFTPHK